MTDLKLISELAELSKIEFSKDELEKITVDMQNIIALMDRVKFDSYPGSFSVTPVEFQDLRPDFIKESVLPEEILKNAKNTAGTSFKVPKII